MEDLESDISMAASTCESTDFTHTSQCVDLTDSDAPKRDGCYLALKRGRVLTKFVSTPRQPSKIPVKNKRSCGRVLTSREQVRIIEEKAKKKEQLEREKEERKKKREEAKKVRDKKRLHCICAGVTANTSRKNGFQLPCNGYFLLSIIIFSAWLCARALLEKLLSGRPDR